MHTRTNTRRCKLIKTITHDDGTETTDVDAIHKRFTDYYQQLFEKEDTDKDTQDKYIKYATKVKDKDRDEMCSPVTEDDMVKIIDSLNLHKTPVPGGLTNEFYQTFKKDIIQVLKADLKDIHERNYCATDFNRAYITLIPKPDTDKTNVTNYRPISLLNSDYKILTKTLVMKIEPFIKSIIHRDQQYNIPDRSIQNHTHTC